MYIQKVLEKKGFPWRIYAVCSDRGDCQLADFIAGLPSNLQKDGERMLVLFRRVAEQGPQRLPDDVCHSIAEDIWEFIRGRLRVVWFYDEGKVVICSHGFVKQSQKTKKNDIERALDAKKRYFADKTTRHIINVDGG